MRVEVLLPLLLAIPVGVAFFMVLSRGWDAHLRSAKDKLAFFFWPFAPERMIVVQELDGDVHIYYDSDYEEVQGDDRTLIKTVDGQQYVTDVPPSESYVNVSMFDARGPSGYRSPFGLAWRWVVAASVLIYFVYFALVAAWIPPLVMVEKVVHGVRVVTAEPAPVDPVEALLATTAFFTLLTWLLSNIARMTDRTVQYVWYHAVGINPPHTLVVPVPGVSNVGLLQYLSMLGREVRIVVPEEARELVERAMQEVGRKVGSKSLAAIILAKLAIAKTWRQALAQVLRERFDLRKAGEASAMIRMGIQPLSKRVIPIAAVALLIGVALGFALGQVFGVGVEPVQTTTSRPAITYTPPPTTTPPQVGQATTTTPPQTTTGITPAPPPPPPTG